jgi:fused signal recognition particle receptor
MKGLGSKLRELFGGGQKDEEFFEELEDLLIEADIGAKATMETVEALREQTHKERISGREPVLRALKEQLSAYIESYSADPDPHKLNVFLVLGVNGVGKTTTIAKLAQRYRRSPDDPGVVLAAGDTFRAAAIEQLTMHGDRLGMRTVQQASGADPAAVIFDALESAASRGDGVVLADTAGRMHNRANLVNELQKIDKIVRRKGDDVLYRRILILDATTGQNALRQAEIFHDAVGVDAVILAKYDSTAKGGILIPIGRELGIPCAFLGRGETYDSLEPFDSDRYLDELLGLA